MSKGNAKAAEYERARQLYMHSSLSQREIVEIVGVSEPTLIAWKNKDKWDEQKKALGMGASAVSMKTRVYLMNLFAQIDSREIQVPTSAEADQISKLSNVFLKMEEGIQIPALLEAMELFLDFMRESAEAEFYRKVAEYEKDFIRHYVSKLDV